MKQIKVYLAGKVAGKKWDIVPKNDDRFVFKASDGSNHSEHFTGLCLYDFNECNDKKGSYASLVKEDFIDQLKRSDLLLAYLDTTDSYGSIAEISYASAIGIPCIVIVKRKSVPVEEIEHGMDEDGMFDAYYFVCSFPGVEIREVHSIQEARATALKELSRVHSRKYVNSYRFMED